MNGGNIDSFIILSDFDSMNPIIIIVSESVKGIDIELDKKTNESSVHIADSSARPSTFFLK
jgi:hypothetical protein